MPQTLFVSAWIQFEPQDWHEMQVANAQAIAAVPELIKALKAYAELETEPCRFDHHGLCQAHNLRRNAKGEPECQMQLVRAALKKAGVE